MKGMSRTCIFSIFAVFLLCVGCGKNDICNVPIGEANFSIDPNSPEYPGINNCDGYEYFVGGNQGIVVIRTGYYTFVAYERTCPYDHGRLIVPYEESGNMVLKCPVCGSRYINTDGAPLEGSVSYCYLYRYGTYYDQSSGRLYVSN